MSGQMKGLISVVIALLSIWSNVTVEVLRLPSNLVTVLIIPIIVSSLAIYLGVQARKNNAKIWGLIGIVLGVVAIVTHIYGLLAISVYRS